MQKITRRVLGCPEAQVGAFREALGEPWGEGRVLQDSWRSQEGSEVQGKAKGELRGVLNMLRGLEHRKTHLEDSEAHVEGSGCRESQVPGSVALQENPGEDSGAVRKENMRLRHVAQGRRGLLGVPKAASAVRRVCAHPGALLSSLGTPAARLQPWGSRRSRKHGNPGREAAASAPLRLPHAGEALPAVQGRWRAGPQGLNKQPGESQQLLPHVVSTLVLSQCLCGIITEV